MSGAVDLHGKKALVTGGTKGIGGAVASRLRDAGAVVLATARSVPREGEAILFVAADVTTVEGCETVAAAVRNHLGEVDIVVHVVGGSSAPAGGFAALGDDEWRRALDLNLFPAVRLDRALLPTMPAWCVFRPAGSRRRRPWASCRSLRARAVSTTTRPANA